MIPWARVQDPIERKKWAEHKHSNPSCPLTMDALCCLMPPLPYIVSPNKLFLHEVALIGYFLRATRKITNRSTKSKERLKSQELSIRTNEYSIKSKSSYDRGWQGGMQASPLWSYGPSVVVCAWEQDSLSLQPNIKSSANLKHYEIFFFL